MTLRALPLVLAILLAGVEAAHAQRIVGTLTERVVAITSTFVGQTLTLFGNVEPSLGSPQRHVEGSFDIVLVIRGPSSNRMARRKTQTLGVWINTEEVAFPGFPSYYRILSSAPLETIADTETLVEAGVLAPLTSPVSPPQGNGDPALFEAELVRLMTENGLFGVDPRGVVFQSNTLFSARITLPNNVPNGTFIAETYLFQNGEQVAKRTESFIVRKVGFERFIGDLALNQPLIYGLLCVALGVFTGWLGGVVFRR